MKTLLTTLLCLSATSFAHANWDVSVSGVYVLPDADEINGLDIDIDNGGGVSLAANYNSGSVYFVGVEYLVWTAEVDSIAGVDLSDVNTELDFTAHNLVALIGFPYSVTEQIDLVAQVGVGAAYVYADGNVGGAAGDDSAVSIVYKGGLSVQYALTQQISLFGGAEYWGYTDLEFDQNANLEGLSAGAFKLGLNYRF
jgi:hypothetical protein